MTSTQQLVTQLNAGWYNYVTQAMQIQDPGFQLAQGTLGLQTDDSSGLFQMADAVPLSAAVSYFDPASSKKRSGSYLGLLEALLPEVVTTLPQVLKDQYTNWLHYKKNYTNKNPDSNATQEEIFKKWANLHLNPGVMAQAIAVFNQASNTPLVHALDAMTAANAKQKFTRSDGQTYSLYPYSCTIDAARSAINTGASATINFDSHSMDTSLKHSTVQGAASGFYDFFSGGASGSFDQLNQMAASSRLTITGKIGAHATLAVTPGEWYTSTEYTRAYNGKDDMTIWNPQANSGDWSSFFAQPNGSLARRTSQLILVSDYEITVRSEAHYSESQFQQIKTHASGGIWPFFSASASSTQTSQSQHNSDGSLTTTHKLDKGLIQVWGAISQNAPN